MKKNLFLALALLFSVSVFAQTRAVIINETFDSSEMPEGWYFTGEGADNFKISSSNNAGGVPNELFFKSSPIVTAGIHLVMATADLTEVEELGLSFKHYFNYDQLDHTIGIATSSDNGTTWNTAWSQTFTNSSATGLHEVNETIKTSDMGKSNVLICLFYEGNTYNFNKWYFDDIMIFAQEGEGTDIQLSSITVDKIIAAGNNNISFIVSNTGSEEITSFEATYEIEGIETVTETFNTNIVAYANKEFSFKKAATLTAGTHEINIKITKVNGEDINEGENNSSSKEVRVYQKSVQRVTMIEHFSSSTCDPCVTVDNTMTTLSHDNEGKYTYVKYPWNYPGTGDPYYLEDCGIRGSYYGVSGVPSITFDGCTTTKSPKQSHFDDSYATPAYIEIIGGFEIEDNNITVKANIIPYIDLTDVKVFMTVNEKTTTGNVGTNGLEEFHHVLMCMLTGSEGIDTSFYVGQKQRYEFVYDMSSTNVEELNDLEVAVWIQSYNTKEIHNSATLTAGFKDDDDNITEKLTSSINIYPNPANDMIFIQADSNVEEITVYDIYGRAVRQQAISYQPSAVSSVNVADLKSGIYFVKITTDEGELVKRFIKN